MTRWKPLLIHLWDVMVRFSLPLRQLPGKGNGKGHAFIEMLYPLIDAWTPPLPKMGNVMKLSLKTCFYVENMVPGCWRKPALKVSP